MEKKIVELAKFKYEKSLKKNGFTVKKDKSENIKVIIKINKD